MENNGENITPEQNIAPAENPVKEAKAKKGKGKIIVIVIISLLIIALAGYLAYDKFFVKKNNQINNNIVNEEKLEENNNLVEDENNIEEESVDNISETENIPASEKKTINYKSYTEYIDLTNGVENLYSDSNKINWKKEYNNEYIKYKLYIKNGILYYKDKNNTVKITNDKLSKEKVIGIDVDSAFGYAAMYIKTESNKIYQTDGEEGDEKLRSKFKNELKKNISLVASDVKELYEYDFGSECDVATFTTYVATNGKKKVLYLDFDTDKIKSIDYDKYDDTRYMGGCGDPILKFNFGNFEISYTNYNEDFEEDKNITLIDSTTNNAIIASYIATLGSKKIFIISKDNDLYILDYKEEDLKINSDGKITSKGKCSLEKNKKSIKISTETTNYIATSAE